MNTKKNLLFVVGARPNFIKIAPICKVLRDNEQLSFKIAHTGQHYDANMTDVFFDELNIPAPDFYLKIGSAPHGKQTGTMMIKLEEICFIHDFSAIIVVGDVNSSLAGALVGAKLNIPVIHVEAGLRSYNRSMPEEINRIATDHVSDLLFAPTQIALGILTKEGLAERSYFSGDVMYDTILEGLKLAEEKSNILNQLELDNQQYYLATLHRPYNVDCSKQLNQIMDGLSQVDKKVLLAAHPRLRKKLNEYSIKTASNIHLTEPFGYLDFIMLEKNAKKVITDSGGVQKEAFFMETPCVTLRPETEWTETLETGANILVQERTAEAILEAVHTERPARYEERPYGYGNASRIIIDTMLSQIDIS